GALWGLNVKTPDHRSTAYGLLVTSDVVLIGIVVPALSGAGFFLAPATIVMTVVAIIATVAFIHDWRASLAKVG
ncbi:MAG TPA: hypothetical protein VF725_08175, partial [Ktedonobacterales bacterium]